MKFTVTFKENQVYQSNYAIATDETSVRTWFSGHEPDAEVLDIQEADMSDEKPGKPVIVINK